MGDIVTIKLETSSPQLLRLGDVVNGGRIIAIELAPKPKLVSASHLAATYGLSAQCVRNKLRDYNLGDTGKGLYDPAEAEIILTGKVKKLGARRKN